MQLPSTVDAFLACVVWLFLHPRQPSDAECQSPSQWKQVQCLSSNLEHFGVVACSTALSVPSNNHHNFQIDDLSLFVLSYAHAPTNNTKRKPWTPWPAPHPKPSSLGTYWQCV